MENDVNIFGLNETPVQPVGNIGGQPTLNDAQRAEFERAIMPAEPARIIIPSRQTEPHQQQGFAAQSPFASSPAMQFAFNNISKGLTQQAEGEVERSEALGAVHQQAAQEASQMQDQRQQALSDYQAFAGEQVKKALEFRDALEKEVPAKGFSDWFANKSTPQKILWGIALGASVAASLTKAGSAPLNFINGVIESDLNAQRERFAKRKDLIGAQDSLLARATSVFQNEQVAMSAVQDVMKAKVSSLIEEQIQKTQNPIIVGKLRTMLAQNEMDREKLRFEQAKNIEQAYQNNLTDRLVGTGIDVDPRYLTPEQRKLRVAGYGLAPTEDDRNKATEFLAQYRPIEEALNSLIRLRGTEGGAAIGTEARDEMQRHAAFLQVSLKDFLKAQRLTDKDTDRISKMIPNNPAAFSTNPLKDRILNDLMEMKRILEIKKDQTLETYGVKRPQASAQNLPFQGVKQ